MADFLDSEAESDVRHMEQNNNWFRACNIDLIIATTTKNKNKTIEAIA